VPCYVDQLAPQVAEATVDVLERAGWERIDESGPSTHTEGVSEDELQSAGDSYVTRLREAVSPLLVRLDEAASSHRQDGVSAILLSLLKDPEPGLIHVEDLDRCYAFDAVRGLRRVELEPSDCHVRASSDSLLYALKFPWGGEALLVNGRFTELRPEGDDEIGATGDRFFRHFRLVRGLNLGRDLSWTTVMKSVTRRIAERFPQFGQDA
jgi:hypothetical protein